MVSTMQKPEVVRENLFKEFAESQILGPFTTVPNCTKTAILKNSTGKWRLIVDLSAPEGFSMNDNIGETLCSLSQ